MWSNVKQFDTRARLPAASDRVHRRRTARDQIGAGAHRPDLESLDNLGRAPRCYDGLMPVKRRHFLLGTTFGWALVRVLPSRAASRAPSASTDPTFAAYVDVLVPADETPSATALGIDKELLVVASGRNDYQRLLRWGVEWLNRQARAQYGRDFQALNEESRDGIVREAAAARADTLPRAFFERTRADVFYHYYARPEAWRGIASYRGPPQPVGFLDYAGPPRTSR